MTAAHRRAARREQQAADLLGSKRTKHRGRCEKKPDVVPIRFADGTLLAPEVKTRAKLPYWLLDAVDQARSYFPRMGAVVPLVVLSELSGEPLAILPLVDLATLVGLREPDDGEQLLLLGARK